MGRSSLALTLALSALLFVGRPARADADADGVHRYELANGLKVRLRAVAGAEQVALVVLYDIGEMHDPEGQSGLGHLVEHCYVTAAAGETPARTAEAMMAAYPQGWNAQTGLDYTVIAFVFPKARLEAEIEDAAARMRDLRVTEADLKREKPRMYDELRNMYSNVPVLAAINAVRGSVLPMAPGARKGGVEMQINLRTVDDVRTRLRTYYRPRNARLVLAGAIDVDAARALVERYFAAIPAGEPPPPPVAVAVEPTRDAQIDTAHPGGGPSSQTPYVCLARKAPAPDASTYAPFLLAVGRLFQGLAAPAVEGFQVLYTPIDAPEILFVLAPVPDGAKADETIARLQGTLDEAASAPLTPVDRFRARQVFAHTLATFPIPDAIRAGNVYGVAFGIGRREQLGIDGAALGARLGEVTDAELGLAGEALLGRANGVDHVWKPAAPSPTPR